MYILNPVSKILPLSIFSLINEFLTVLACYTIPLITIMFLVAVRRDLTQLTERKRTFSFSLKIYLKVVEKTRQQGHAAADLVVPTVNEKREGGEYSLLLTVHV